MILVLTAQETEVVSELRMQFCGGVAHHRQPTATLRPVLGESRYEYVATGFDCAPDLIDVSRTIRGVGKEVKDSALMPDRVSALEHGTQNVGNDPSHFHGTIAKSVLRHGERSWGEVENRQIGVASVEEIVCEHGRTAADVDDRSVALRRYAIKQIE